MFSVFFFISWEISDGTAYTTRHLSRWFVDNRFLFAEDQELYHCTPSQVKRLMAGVRLDFLPHRFAG